jgi:hypothetical protein
MLDIDRKGERPLTLGACTTCVGADDGAATDSADDKPVPITIAESDDAKKHRSTMLTLAVVSTVAAIGGFVITWKAAHK